MVGYTISHFMILEKIGAGSMGEVFKAEDLNLGRNVALKFLAEHLLGDDGRGSVFIVKPVQQRR
jgi:serine/threonine protein kinase